MLITAVINNRGNTLVLDLPRDRIDLDTKLYSIGQELAHNTPITEDPDNDVTVKLSADSDIGVHMIKLFNDSHTLRDVNNLANAVMNAPDEVKEALESDILNDQYSTPDELVEEIKKQTFEAGQYTETFYFPLVGMLEDEEYDDEYEVGNPFLMDYKWDIRELVEKEQDADLGDMKDYFYDDDNAQPDGMSLRRTADSLAKSISNSVSLSRQKRRKKSENGCAVKIRTALEKGLNRDLSKPRTATFMYPCGIPAMITLSTMRMR